MKPATMCALRKVGGSKTNIESVLPTKDSAHLIF